MKEIEWVKNFGIRTDVLTIHALASGQKYIKKAYGLPNCLTYKYVDGEEFRDKKYLDQLNQIASRNIKRTVIKVVTTLSRVSDYFEKLCREKKTAQSDENIFREYKKFYNIYSYFLGICDIPVFLEEAVSQVILGSLEKRVDNNIDKYFKSVTTYLGESYVAAEERNLLKLAIRAKRYKNIFRNNKKIKDSKFFPLVATHHKKYSWTGYRVFNGKAHSIRYFLYRIKENIDGAEKKLAEISKKRENSWKERNQTAKKYKLDLKLLECAQKLIWIRDKRIAAITRGCSYERKFLEVAAKRLGLKLGEFIHMLPEEVEAAFTKRKKISRKVLQERERGFALQVIGGRLKKIISGEKLEKLRQQKVPKIKELKGTPANSGKAVGKARLIIHDKDFPKFRVGEILVTNMTTPDYTPLMKKASAIVTDLGGITCHAAIISREIGKPCIVGTEIATRALKTGDLVEVDANKGIVRKL